MRRGWIGAVAAIGAVCGCALAAEAPDERVTVDRVLWPVQVEPAGCTPDLAAIHVTENKRSVEVTSFDRNPRPTLHTLLIDTSASMAGSGRLDKAKAAAHRYIDRLRPDESVMLLTFDESLVLRAPRTSLATPGARERLDAAIDAFDTGTLTLLYDALAQLILHVEAFPQRQVIVVLTDGYDVSSRRHRLEDVLETSPAKNLTIFSVGVAGDKRKRSGNRSTLESTRGLGVLAESTGGVHLEVASADEAAEAFDAIRDRLEDEAWLGWEAPPFGALKGDPGGKFEYTFRKVRIRTDDDTCTVVSPRERRFVTRRGFGELRWPPAGAEERPLELPLPMPDGLPANPQSRWYLEVEDTAITGRVLDPVYEGGLLYESDSEVATIVPPGSAILAVRNFRLSVPPPAQVGHGPEDILLHWLAHGRQAVAGNRQASTVHLDALAGETLLRLSEFLGDALYRYFREYRDAIRGPLRGAIENELRRTLPGVDPEALASLVAARLDAPTRVDIGRFLAVWLGDVSALDLSERLQRRVLFDLRCAAAASRSGPRQRLEEVLNRWDDVRGWLAPPDRVRVLAPLFLVREDDRFGFYRIVLPRPSLDGPPTDRVAAVPQILIAAAPLLECDAQFDRLADIGVRGDEVRLGFAMPDDATRVPGVTVRIVRDAPQDSRPPDCIVAWSGDSELDRCIRAAGLDPCE